MEAVFTYLAKSGALIAVFWLAYFLLLRKETFFKSNRWYLLFGLVTSVVLPLVTFKKVIWVEPVQNVDWTTIPSVQTMQPAAFEINWWIVAGIIYSIGITAFLLRFFIDFYALKKALRGKLVTQQADFRFVDTTENVAPFSYFSYIVYNSSLYSPMELQNILEHEKVHSDQYHSADVLITRLFCIAFWFNPFVWLYKQSVLQNLEFIADYEATKNLADKKSYQFTLLKVTAHENCVDITNHFYQSLIKKRIVMLNKNQSKKWNSWKYALIVPALAAFMFYFQVKVIAQEKQAPPQPESVQPAAHVAKDPGARVVVTKNTSDAEMKAQAEKIKKEQGVTLKFSKVKRNSAGEITCIKMEFKDKDGKKGITQIVDDKPIKPITFYKNEDGALGFGSPRDVTIIRNGEAVSGDEDDENSFAFSFDNDDDEINVDIDAPEPPEAPEPAAAPGAPPKAPKAPHAKSIIIRKGHGGGSPMVIVDGEVVTDAEQIIENIDPIEIEGLNDIQGNGTRVYNKNGKKVIVVDSRKISRDARKQVREEMERARPQIEKAMRAVERARGDIERSEMSREQVEAARAEMDKARAELDKARAELDKQRADLEKEKSAQKK